MAHKTFISYKYSESRFYRDQILDALGDDAVFYKGETSDSPNLTDTTTENIKNHLKQMIYDTTVTIIVLSPNMLQSNWIDWEISYSLKKHLTGWSYIAHRWLTWGYPTILWKLLVVYLGNQPSGRPCNSELQRRADLPNYEGKQGKSET